MKKEVRIFIIPESDKNNKKARRDKDGKYINDVKPKCKYVDIDWIDIIEDVKIDKNCTSFEVALLQDKLNMLVEEKREYLSLEEYKKLKSKVQLKKFDPYKDDSLKQGPLQITTKNK